MEWENASARRAHLLTTSLSMTWMRKITASLALGIIMSLLGWIFARLHLHVFDPMFLRGGSLETYKKA